MIVNRGENDGFVIIRSEGDSHTILGYSEHGHINTEAMPENLRYWLQCYVAENEQTILSYKNDHVKYKAHAPLLTTIAWDQNDPYNLMTPYYVGTTHAATGCAATAMAQILYFHHWPLQGKGTASYKCSTLNNATLTADFSKDTYNWASMKPQYNIPGDNDQESSREAVALLMRDCGYAIHMLRLVDLTNSSFITPKDLASCTFVLSSPTTDINANSAPAIKHPHSAVSYDLRGIRIYDHHHGAVIVGKKKMIK